MIVVDASALIEVLLRTTGAADMERRLFDGGVPLSAPEVLDLEVAQQHPIVCPAYTSR